MRREQLFVTRRLVMHWSSILASANQLRKGQRFVRPSRKDAGRDLCGLRNGVFQVSRTKPCAQLEPFITETEYGDRLSAELDGYELNGRFVGHDPSPFRAWPYNRVDCVVPTRLARNGTALTPSGHLSLRQAAMRDDQEPIDSTCSCPACSRFSRAYLRHLFKAGEILAHRLVSVHNLTHLGRLMEQARAAIAQGSFNHLRAATESAQGDGAAPGPG
jgi:hypothetical protein